MEGKLQISTMSCKPLGSIISFIPLGYKILIDTFFFPESIKKRKYVPETEVEVGTQCDDEPLFEQNSQFWEAGSETDYVEDSRIRFFVASFYAKINPIVKKIRC